MNPNSLAPWRDLALMLLCLEAFVFLAVPAALFYFAQKYLRQFRHWLRMPLLRVHVYTLRAQNMTIRASNAVAGAPISVQMLGARVRATARRFVARP